MPKVSVIIPVYNTEKYLRKCLDSVCNQTLSDIEIICVNDCSTDSSLEILKGYASKDNRIKLIDFKENKGSAVARNTGIDEATGEYIGFVDSDDWVDLDFYEKLYIRAKHIDAEVVRGNILLYENNEKKYIYENLFTEIEKSKVSFNGLFVCAIYKLDFIKSNEILFLEKYSYGEDRLFPLKASILSHNFSLVKDSYYNYCVHDDSASSIKTLSIYKINDYIQSTKVLLDFIGNKINKEEALGLIDSFIVQTFSMISQCSDNKTLYAFLNELFLKKCNILPEFQKNSDILFKYIENRNYLKLKTSYDKILCKINIFSNLRNTLKSKTQVKNIKNSIPVFLAADNNYAPFVASTIASICDNTKAFVNFYILDSKITKENQAKICELKKQFNNFSIEFLEINLDKYFKDFVETNNYKGSMYSRFLIPYLKPQIDKAIYSDVDVIFYGDIQDLYNENLEGYALGAVWEDFFEDSYNKERKKNIELSKNHKYFSSGNLLIDCKQWREKNILKDLLELYKQYEDKLKWPDQDILNKYFDCNYKQLDRKYCFLEPCYKENSNPKFIIRHYVGQYKPWKVSPFVKTDLVPDKDMFWHYLKMTPFYEDMLNKCEITPKNIMKYRLLNIYNGIRENKKVSIPIILSSDDNYSPFIATTIVSICTNTNSYINFYILDGGISDKNKEQLYKIQEKIKNFSIEFIKVDTNKYFKDFITTSYITVATYYRFLLAELFPNIPKALYLDVDIILKGDITELFNINLDSHIIGAAIDRGDPNYINKLKNNIGLNLSSPYFNAGVLLINIDLWNKNNITKKLFETERRYRGKLECNDQDVLNIIFENNYKILDDKYNSMEDNDNVILRHYYGLLKPWTINPKICTNKYQEYRIFWNVAQETPFYEKLIEKCQYNHLAQLKIKEFIQKKEKEKNNA